MPTELKTVRELIQITSRYFAEKDIDSPRLNAERLLSDVLSLSRIELYLQHDRPLTGEELQKYRDYVRRRAGGEPLQTIIGTTEFYSRSFKVEPDVFIPRPETEILVDQCLRLLTPSGRRLIAPQVVEIGCGCGVIGITLAAELPNLLVTASDVDPAAVRLSRFNAHRLGVAPRLKFLVGDGYAPLSTNLKGKVDLLVSNPPYIRSDDIVSLPREVAEHDPPAALDGGSDGLNHYRALAAGFAAWLAPDGAIAVEIGYDQAEAVVEIFQRTGCRDIAVHQDYNDLPRVVTARRAAPLAA
jgi:release factor glutamine methyltransferase